MDLPFTNFQYLDSLSLYTIVFKYAWLSLPGHFKFCLQGWWFCKWWQILGIYVYWIMFLLKCIEELWRIFIIFPMTDDKTVLFWYYTQLKVVAEQLFCNVVIY